MVVAIPLMLQLGVTSEYIRSPQSAAGFLGLRRVSQRRLERH
jgi:hypothetical protein